MRQYPGKVHSFLVKQKSTAIIFSALVFAGMLGWLDYASGNEIIFSFFYLIPIALTVIYTNMGTSFAITALCVAVWVFSNQWMGEGYSSEAISIWNTFIQLATFSIFAILLNELKNTISHKKALVYTDSLTGLNNRREFCRYLQMEIYRAQRYNSPFAVAYIDINSFKLINDKLGHAAGDYLLHYIGQSMKNSLRKTDFVARTGGDEFAVLFPEIDEKGAQCAMGKLREYLANKMTQDQTSVTFSMALAHFPVAPHYSAEELIKKAEQLMLQAKMQRKDGVVFKQME